MSGGTLRITATVDPTSIPPRLIAIVGLDVIPGKVSFVQQQISKLPSAIFVSSVSGRFEMLFLLRVNMVSELAMIMNETISKIEGIRASETFVCLDVAKGGLIQL
jgi:DNA-binding Lrp family transcriptional regulator